jgi:hypothetical protein
MPGPLYGEKFRPHSRMMCQLRKQGTDRTPGAIAEKRMLPEALRLRDQASERDLLMS